MRLVAGDAAAGIEHQGGLGRADHGGQRDGQPETGMKAEPGEIGAEARLGAGHAEIGDHRQPQPAADRSAVDRRDDRLFGAKQPVALDIEVATPGDVRRGVRPRGRASAVAEIGAGAERFSLRGQHEGTAIGVLIECLEGGGDFPDQLYVEKVIRRPSDLHQRHMAGFLDADILEGTHGILRLYATPPRRDVPSATLRLTISASTTDTPCRARCTRTGLRSISAILSAISVANCDSRTMRSTSASVSAGGARDKDRASARP